MEDQTLEYLKQASEISHKVNGVQNDINYIYKQMASVKQMNTTSYTLTILSATLGWLPGIIVGSMIRSLLSIKGGGITLIFAVIGYGVLLALSIKYDSDNNKKRKEQYTQRLSELQNEVNYRNDWISSYLDKHIDVVSKVPPKYFYPIAIDYFVEVISNGRADTLKEAMNLFEEQLHRWKIEDMTKSAMIAQQQTAANSAAIRTSSAINAAANVANLLSK